MVTAESARKMPNKNNKITGIKHLLGIAVIALSMTPAVALGDEIADVFDQLLSSPDDPALNLRYAELALAKGETRKALSAHERILARDPTNR